MYLYGMIFNLWAYTWSQGSLGSVLDPSAGELDQFYVTISIVNVRDFKDFQYEC